MKLGSDGKEEGLIDVEVHQLQWQIYNTGYVLGSAWQYLNIQGPFWVPVLLVWP